jgi:hypothetical protein
MIWYLREHIHIFFEIYELYDTSLFNGDTWNKIYVWQSEVFGIAIWNNSINMELFLWKSSQAEIKWL